MFLWYLASGIYGSVSSFSMHGCVLRSYFSDGLGMCCFPASEGRTSGYAEV